MNFAQAAISLRSVTCDMDQFLSAVAAELHAVVSWAAFQQRENVSTGRVPIGRVVPIVLLLPFACFAVSHLASPSGHGGALC